uniref:Ig-like domain-containing protein n=1 Tax=Anas platyrhynchos platyrhynchos TaxID=8840 RepID=A0A493SUM2_ANAPP
DPVFSPLSSPSPGSLVQAALTQPASKSVNPGDTVQITCSGSSDYYYGWSQQKTPGSAPVTVISRDSNRPSGIPLWFSGSASDYAATLTITGDQTDNETISYCGSYNSSATADTVTQRNGEVIQKPPAITGAAVSLLFPQMVAQVSVSALTFGPSAAGGRA